MSRAIGFVTESGSAYEFNSDNPRQIRRVASQEVMSPDFDSVDLRRDEEWIELLRMPQLSVGARTVLELEPLGPDADVTLRWTTPVTEIITEEITPSPFA